MKVLLYQASRFFVVGLLAMATHFAIFSLLIRHNMAPLVANVLAFLGAFQVSFWGHFYWSFRGMQASRRSAMVKFFAVATGSFLINEAMLATLLRWTALSSQIALLITLFTVALMTFLLSRFWAFAK